jgi:pimeloyl-ACP methyl ester carboxylesterase
LLWRTVKFLLLLVLAIIFILVALGGIRTLIQLRAAPPYEMVAVERDRRLHTVCEGPEDAPFVLFDAGAFGNYTHGWWVMEALQEDHRICLYDRAGMGWSDPVPQSVAPDPDWHVDDMRRLTAALGQDEPYVLIGHSMAGLRLHAYANAYPEDLRGLVFVDAVRPQALELEQVDSFRSRIERMMTVSILLSRTGLTGGAIFMIPNDFDHTGQRQKDNRRALSSVQHQKATRAEMTASLEAFPTASWRVESNAEQFPVFVFTNFESSRSNAPVAQLALENTGLGGVTLLPDASHVSLLNEENAKLIARDVRKITGQEE